MSNKLTLKEKRFLIMIQKENNSVFTLLQKMLHNFKLYQHNVKFY